MTIPHKLSEFTDMTKEKFQECLERVNMKAFMENPTQALTDAGVTLKKGVTLKFVETKEEADALPSNVFPLWRTQKNNEQLTLGELDKIAGGGDPSNWGKAVGIQTDNEKKGVIGLGIDR